MGHMPAPKNSHHWREFCRGYRAVRFRQACVVQEPGLVPIRRLPAQPAFSGTANYKTTDVNDGLLMD